MGNEIQKVDQNENVSLDIFGKDFEQSQRIAKCLASSSVVPEGFQGRVDNCMIALDMAQRVSVSPLAIMQNMYVVYGRPGFEAKFIIGMVNTSGRFSRLKFVFDGEGDDYGCRAVAIELSTGEECFGTKINRAMVVAEGWSDKKGSKWKTMPEQMYKYRAASFWQREHCPELTMGVPCVDEIEDMINAGEAIVVKDAVDPLEERVAKKQSKQQPPQQQGLSEQHLKILELAEKVTNDPIKLLNGICQKWPEPKRFSECKESADFETLECDIEEMFNQNGQ